MANLKSKKRRKTVIFTAIGLVLVALTLVAIFKKRTPVVQVETEKVSRQDITEVVLANGRIQPVVQVKISAEVSGEIIALPVKEGQMVRKGDLLVQIKPDVYEANRRSAEASYRSALASQSVAEANCRKAELELKRNEELFRNNLISDSVFQEIRTACDVARANVESAKHAVEVAKASLKRAEEELAKTTIYSPIDGTVTRLSAELGERVVGTALMSGTEIMTVADLSAMEARVEVGETDVVLTAPGQTATLEVDAFRDRKFQGVVTEIANMTRPGLAAMGGGGASDATRFEVRIRFNEPEAFRPGMSVNAEIRTRSRTNVLAVPVQSVTTRPPKPAESRNPKASFTNAPSTNAISTNLLSTNAATTSATTNAAPLRRKKDNEKPKPIKVVFVVEGDHVKMVPVKVGINDQDYVEILDGLTEGQEVVSGSFRVVSKELEDGKKIARKKTGQKK